MNKTSRILLLVASVSGLALLGLLFVQNLIDFPVYYQAGQSLLSGRTDLYAPDFARGRLMDYRYPPLFLLLFYPLWMLPFKEAAYAWYVLSILQIAGSVFAIKGMLGPPGLSKKVWLVTFFAVAQYFVMILHYGNAHLLAIFLLFAGLYCYYFRKDYLASALIGLSITIKLTPILILPYFALKKRWNLLLLVAGFLVLFNLMPAAYFGFDRNLALLENWVRHVVVDQEFHESNGPVNLSLKGQLRRYLTEIDYSKRFDKDTRYPAVNVARVSTVEADRLWYVLGSTVFLCGLLLIWRGARIREREAQLTTNAPSAIRPLRDSADDSSLHVCLDLGLMVCLMLFVGPLTSKIYFTALVWPVAALASYAFTKNGPAATLGRRVVVIVAVTNSVLPLLPGSSIQRLLLVAGIDFYVNLLLMAAQGYALVSARQSFQDSGGGLQRPALSETRTP
jgi:hypothetical protein